LYRYTGYTDDTSNRSNISNLIDIKINILYYKQYII
jgi:hypothetical protein